MTQKIVIVILFLLGIYVISYEGYGVYSDYRNSKIQKEALDKEAHAIISENNKIEGDLNRLEDNEVIIRELKSRFNYKFPDEKLIIVAPKKQQP